MWKLEKPTPTYSLFSEILSNIHRKGIREPFSSVQFSSVAQSCPTLCDPMNCSTPGLPVHHQLPEFTETHVHRVSDAIQQSHPLSSPSPPAPNPSQHQSLFQWVSSSREVAKVLEFQVQHHSPLRSVYYGSKLSRGEEQKKLYKTHSKFLFVNFTVE